MPNRPHIPQCLLLLLTAAALVGAAKAAPPPLMPFLEQHCVECHDADVKKGGLDLQSLDFNLANPASFQHWRRVFERVRDGEMPPAKKPQPPAPDAKAFLTALHTPLLEADRADVAQNGRVRSRRLTRTEYEYTVHDLLGIDIPLKDLLPADRASHGFETVADGQQLSHHQLATYLDTADLALSEAFDRALKGDAPFRREFTPRQLSKSNRGNNRAPEYRAATDESISWPITLQFFGRMHATEVDENGWYRVTLRAVRAINPGKDGTVWGTLRSGYCESNAPIQYLIGLIEATAEPRDMVFEAWMQKTHVLELRPNDGELRRAQTGAKGGNVSFAGRDLEQDGFSGIAHRGIIMERIHPLADSATVRQNLFGELDPLATPEPQRGEMLRASVARFAALAFRRPVTADQLAPYLDIGRKALAAGESLPESLRASYRAILCSPRFLTLVEAPGALDDHSIASRLSYALWISRPDARLLRLAQEGRLRDPAHLLAEVQRMLSHKKAERFIHSFTDQWLKLKEIDFTSPDTRQFRSFDPVLQESMLQETRAFFAKLLRDDLPISNLVDSDFAFLNTRLARHYRCEAPLTPGAGLRQIALTEDSAAIRGGLITQGAVLKVTADGTSTSPVVRGVFINERILGTHIPPPPPGVPAIEPDIRGATSIRDQLEKHRENSSCAACHAVIDPPGFALENFDPVGGWRTRYGKGGKESAAVNPSGTTPDGATFAGLAEWQRIYTQRPRQLARAFAQHFLTYATGAPIRFSDEAVLDQIVTDTGKNHHGLRSILTAALRSPVFLNK